jgi:hypothetical protein
MTNKRYLSDKKTSQQTISISPSLKDWIRRYVSVMHKKNPDDEDYKSISAFYCSVMENILKIFERGKSLIDFEHFPDSEIHKFYGEEARFSLPFVEASMIMSSFTPVDFFFDQQIFYNMANLVSKSIEPYSMDSIKNLFARVINRQVQNNVIKDARWEVYPKKGNKGFDGMVEYSGNYRFLHINNVKFAVALIGLVGLKVTEFHYSGEDKYVRIKFTTDELFFNKEEAIEARTKLAKKNKEYVINLFRIIKHGSPHFWLRLSDNNHNIISFRNEDDFNECLAKVESDLKKYGSKEDYSLYILKVFEQINWIRIIDELELSFQFLISENRHKNEIEMMLGYLSKYFKVLEKDQNYYLQSNIS